MKTIALLGLVASLLTAAPAFADTAGTSGLCGPDGPEAYNRPGGYCEILGANASLSEPTTERTAGNIPDAPDPCEFACKK
jgi:hypothetical protein